MRFRTEIEPLRAGFEINHDTPLLMLGSCFTDEIGSRLEADGFDVLRNPLGPLYNPLSIARCLSRAATGDVYTVADLTPGPRGFHCLDYALRYSGDDAEAVLAAVNSGIDDISAMLRRQPIVVMTLGSSFVYELIREGRVVGNCHKFPAADFNRRRMSVAEVTAVLDRTVSLLGESGVRHVIFTVSPIRHLADGLHGNGLSKATLQLGLDALCSASDTAVYFPSYEIMVDDLRDYRFYASDMKHPSEVAVDYIYEKFADAFFSKKTLAAAAECRRRFKAENHRPIL